MTFRVTARTLYHELPKKGSYSKLLDPEWIIKIGFEVTKEQLNMQQAKQKPLIFINIISSNEYGG